MNEHDARQVACDWHSGQWSPLYAFCSSGTIVDPDNLISEIDAALTIDVQSTADAHALYDLRDYVYRQFPEPDDGP